MASRPRNSRTATSTTSTPTTNPLVLHVNQAPTLTVPGDQIASEDVAKAITGIRVGDVDSDRLTVTLSVGHGTLSISKKTGLTISGNGPGSVSVTG